MRIKIWMETKRPLRLPMYHNHILQAWVYNLISDEVFRRFLHDQGYEFEKRTFRLFTFSRLHGGMSIDRERKEFVFKEHLSIQIGSPVDVLLEDVVNTGLSKENMFLGENRISINSVEVLPGPSLDASKESYKLRTLSPIVVYSTFLHRDKKKTHYYSPTEPEFSQLISENLQKKHIVLQDQEWWRGEAPIGDFAIRPLYSPAYKGETVTYYKDFFIKGHMGLFEVKAHPSWLKLAWEVGLGSKNSQGFGMVDVVEGEKKK